MDIVDIRSAPIKVFTDAYRKSLAADDTNNMFDIAYQWQDKPHRHVWDLCEKLEEAADEIERLRQQNAELVKQIKYTILDCDARTSYETIKIELTETLARATGGE